jgi:hypothetical protein
VLKSAATIAHKAKIAAGYFEGEMEVKLRMYLKNISLDLKQ